MSNSETCRKVKFDKLDATVQNLIRESVQVRQNAYCPYSNFKVGAALLTDSEVFTGCNIENAAYGATICAERAAIVKSISAGHLNFEAIAVCADSEGGVISPCGLCRQFISEFAKNDIAVYLSNSSMEKIVQTSIKELLPMSFSTM